jgi:hypothetical protein
VWQSLIHSAAEGLFLFLFFVFFQPFDMAEWQDPNKNLKILGFAAVTTFCTFASRVIFLALFPRFFEEKNWVVWKEILNVLFLLLCISICNMLYGSLILKWNISLNNLLLSFWYVLVMAFFPVVFWVLADYIYKLKKYSKPVVIQEKVDIESDESLVLVAENGKDFLEIKNKELLYIESADNYCTIFYLVEKGIKKFLLRSSLTRLEGQIKDQNILRTHRSYIANLSHTERVSGNAQGYFLHLKHNGIVVPVARKYSAIVENLK